MSSKWAALWNIHPSEGWPMLGLLIHSFFLGITLVFFYTAANALFLATFDVKILPYAYIISAGVITLGGFLYSKLEKHLPVTRLLPGTLAFLFISVCAFYLGLWVPIRWLVFGLLIWADMLDMLIGLEFWGLAGRLFNVRQGKRLFGLIGSGDTVTRILSGFSIPLLVQFLGTPNLLLISAGGLVLCLIVLQIILHRFRERILIPQEEKTETKKAQNQIFHLLKDRYLVLIFLLTVFSVFATYFLNYIFLEQVKADRQHADELSSFLGVFYGAADIVSLGFRALLSGRLLNRHGLKVGLILLPLMLAVGTVLTALAGTIFGAVALFFWLVAMNRLTDRVLRKAIFKPAFLILYQPLRASERLSAQVAVEGIVGPVSSGLAGISLLLFNLNGSFSPVQLAYIMLFILAGWVMVSILIQSEYAVALTQALTRRTLEGVSLSLGDASSLAVLKGKLKSSHPNEIIYSLNILEKIEHDALDSFLMDLLEHPAPEVRRDVLLRIERRVEAGFKPASSVVTLVDKRLKLESSPSVQAAALRALCALGEAEVVEQVAPYLENPDPQVRMGAMIGLLRNGGIAGILLAGENLTNWVDSPAPHERELAAQVLGEVGIRSFYHPLLKLLRDDDPQVHRAALIAAGKVQNPKLWPLVLEDLASPMFYHAAASALVVAGESVLSELASVFNKKNQPREVLIRIARICGRIRGNQVITLLRDKIDFPDKDVRYYILVSLSLCGYRAQDGEILRVHKKIQEEIEDATWTLAALVGIGEEVSVFLLKRVLTYELEQNQKRILLLLSFIYDSQSILRARDNLLQDSPEKKAYALEIIDLLVSQELKPMLFPLLEDLTPTQRLNRLHAFFPQQSLDRDQQLERIISRSDQWIHPWTKTCALYALAHNASLANPSIFSAVISALSDFNPVIRETAIWALSRLDPLKYQNYTRSLPGNAGPEIIRAIRQVEAERSGEKVPLLLIERVILLKTLGIFSETPEQVLVEVASILEEVEIKAGQPIFEKGDMGSCMYIIIDGQVRVHDGAQTLRNLGPGDIFGELSVLDPEPRSASVTALENTRLFRLYRDGLYELMTDHIEVVRGIIRVLCRWLRAGNQKIVEYVHSKEILKKHLSEKITRTIKQTAGERKRSEFVLLPLEKVIILKTVTIFSETSEEILAEIASLLEEMELGAGETIFEKGDMESCMYIVIDGRVRIHEREQTLAYAGEREIFGEMAVLDPEPRSASATTTEVTRLFRLNQDALYMLMADHIEVVHGIIRVLCKRIRAQYQTQISLQVYPSA
jgi:CRP-like cAMP-binding protein/ATP/ADP translocase